MAEKTKEGTAETAKSAETETMFKRFKNALRRSGSYYAGQIALALVPTPFVAGTALAANALASAPQYIPDQTFTIPVGGVETIPGTNGFGCDVQFNGPNGLGGWAFKTWGVGDGGNPQYFSNVTGNIFTSNTGGSCNNIQFHIDKITSTATTLTSYVQNPAVAALSIEAFLLGAMAVVVGIYAGIKIFIRYVDRPQMLRGEAC